MTKSKPSFQKFIQQEESGAKKKERIRQEKKKARKETQEYFAKKKEEYRAFKTQNAALPNQDTRTTGQRDEVRKPHFKSRKPTPGYSKPATDKKGPQRERKPYEPGNKKTSFHQKQVSKDRPAFTKPATGKPNYKPKDYKPKGITDKPSTFSKAPVSKPTYQPSQKTAGGKESTRPAPKVQHTGGQAPARKMVVSKTNNKEQAGSNKPAAGSTSTTPAPSGTMPLNKFIAHAGICSRRDAADIVRSGKVIVNGAVVTEPGFKVSGKDEIKVNGKTIAVRRNLVYILLNKPKDFITTTEDPQGRKTVLDIVKHATTERVYPIGRLDRNTTGVLLLTNDGELAQKLSHPSYEVKKIYEVTLDKPLLKKDFDTILNGLTLEDGFIAPDVLAYADTKEKNIIGIEIHSGRNRIVRRIFEAVGYDVRGLDRVMYANLTKKNVERGKWRFLNEKEVRLLKYLNASYSKNKPAQRG